MANASNQNVNSSYESCLKAACQKMTGKTPDKVPELEKNITAWTEGYSEYGVELAFDRKAGTITITPPSSAIPEGQEKRIHKHELKVADFPELEFAKALANEIDHLEDELYCAGKLASGEGGQR